MLAGEVSLGGTAAGSGCYATVDADTEVVLASRCGARLLAWADVPARWHDGVERGDLYGW